MQASIGQLPGIVKRPKVHMPTEGAPFASTARERSPVPGCAEFFNMLLIFSSCLLTNQSIHAIILEEGKESRSIVQEARMYPVIGTCPVCGETLTVTRLYCRTCDTTVEGHFTLGRFYHLSPEQMAFVETFIRCEGKLTRVQEELGMSYPTVRSRLNEVIRALGYEVSESKPEVSPDERRSILEQLGSGEISSQEAVQLLQGD
jgi:hypothetical protein